MLGLIREQWILCLKLENSCEQFSMLRVFRLQSQKKSHLKMAGSQQSNLWKLQ